MERTCVGLLAIPADAAHQLLVYGLILPVHLIDLAFFGTLRNGGPADVQRRCRDPATLQALQLRVAGYPDLSLRQHHSCKSGAERDRRQRSPQHLFLPECYPGVVRINEHDVFDHLRDSSSPCERAPELVPAHQLAVSPVPRVGQLQLRPAAHPAFGEPVLAEYLSVRHAFTMGGAPADELALRVMWGRTPRAGGNRPRGVGAVPSYKTLPVAEYLFRFA